ncbi:MAG: BON domain-containing protein [Gammaproteobacteria bacterium]|nr:BON domain-containing protein [Gammaproteobacteria bacterium]
MNRLCALFFALILPTLQACAPVVVAGAAGGAAAGDTRSGDVLLSDQIIESQGADTLYRDPGVARRIHINITSYNEVVLLTGEALSTTLRQQAVDTIRHMDRVRRVHNEVRVADLTGFQSRTRDSWITSKIKGRMLAAEGFPSGRIKVVTEAGSVFLMGLVSKEIGTQAAEIARRVDDVKRVVKLFEYP